MFSSILSASGGISWLMQPFTVVFRFCGLSADGWYVLLTGLLCGCPMGAKTCADFLAERRLSSSEAKFLFALCNHPSPMFLAGFVYPMFAAQLPLFCFVFAIYILLKLLIINRVQNYGKSRESMISKSQQNGARFTRKEKFAANCTGSR